MTVLESILEGVREDLAAREAQLSFDVVKERAAKAAPPLDVMAIDNLPSLLPVESSEDYARQLLPSLLTLDDLKAGVWGRAFADFTRHTATL